MKLYLAGPDVFRPDAGQWAEDARALCAAQGHQALVPLDGIETSPEGIYRANIALIRAADVVLANLNPFRGCEPDSGTCFEVGFAIAQGKPVIGYLDSKASIVERTAAYYGAKLNQRNGRPLDPEGNHIEDFGLPLNLMLAIPSSLVLGGLEKALDHLAAPANA